MAVFGFLILFGLNCVVFPCEGKIQLPPDGDKLTFVKGKTGKIPWSFDNKIETVIGRSWAYAINNTNDWTKAEFIGSIDSSNKIKIGPKWSSRIEIEEQATLILKNVDVDFTGAYQFTLLAPGADTSVVTVLIAETPTVEVNCSGTTTIDEGDYFACRCKGEGGNPKPVNVTWYDANQAQVDATGKEEKILTLSNVKKTENGIYKCEAKTHELTKNETSIQLIVNFKPDITSLTSSPPKPAVGQEVTITCVANALPQPSYTIFHNGTKVSDNEIHTISGVVWDDAGTYVCNATNRLGNDLKSYNLIVVAKDEESDSGGLGAGAIVGIVIGVLVVVVIIVGVIYWFKCKPNGKDHGSRKDTEEKAKKKRGDENVYDAVNMDDKASGSRSSHELESPMNYAVLDKQALNTGAPKKPERNAEESTAYASIDVGKVGQVEADLV